MSENFIDSVASLHALFEAQVACRPRCVALRDTAGTVTYAELNAHANQVARHLVALGARPGQRVAVCLPRTRATVVALLALLKAGLTSVPMDTSLPEARQQDILRDASPTWLLMAGPQQGRELTSATCIDLSSARIACESTEDLGWPARPDACLGVLYTSGVTGRPKGVVVPARAVLGHMFWMWRRFPFRDTDVALLHRSMMLISASWDYLGPLLRGVPSLLVSEAESHDPSVVWRMCADVGVTHASGAPAFWDVLIASAERHPGVWSSLRLGTISGEQVNVRIVRRWQRAFPGARLLNVYGSTECVRPLVYDTTDLPGQAERVPIGSALPGVRVFIADEQLQAVEPGQLGEICVAGDCLTDGYLNQPELTGERFTSAPALTGDDIRVFRTGDLGRQLADGSYEVSGRRDQQVKIRGLRVELGDVEAALLAFPGLRQVAIVAIDDGASSKVLVAYTVMNPDTAPMTAPAWRAFLGARLPDSMIPTFFVQLDDLPRTRSGKTDWSALPAPQVISGADDGGAHSDGERLLLEIWHSVFGLRTIGRDDDFFALGGHSLLAMQISSRVTEAVGVDLSMDVWSSQPTVRRMARVIDDALAARRAGAAGVA